MNDSKKQLSVAEYASLIWQRRKTALLAAGLFACLTLVVFNFIPRKYTSQAEFERRGDTISARTDGKIPESFRNFKPVLKHDLAGPAAIRAALEELGCLADLPRGANGELTPEAAADVENITERLKRDLDVQWVVNSDNVDRVAISFRCSDPSLTYKLPNQLMANYIRKTTQELRDQLTTSATFLSEQVTKARTTIENLREQQFRFTAEHPDMMPEHPQFFVDRLNQADNDLEDLRQQHNALESRIAAMKGLPTLDPTSPVTTSLELNALKKQLHDALTVGQMTPKHPKVIRLQQAIVASETFPADAAVGASFPGILSVGGSSVMELTHLSSELERVNSQIARKEETRGRYEKTQANLLPVMQEYQRLSNRVADAEKEAREWQQELAEVQMALNAEKGGTRTHLQQVRLASPVYQPTWPPLWLVFGAALAGGPAFGIVLVILMARFSRTFGSPDHAKVSLGMPLLGVIGPIFSPAHSRLHALRRHALAPALASLLLAVLMMAGIGVVMASKYPERYARMMDQAGPTARSMWSGMQSLLGSM